MENISYEKAVVYVAGILEEYKKPYAFVKYAFLIPFLYKTEQQSANEIDILIEECNIAELQCILKKHGFKQGSFNDKLEFLPADKWEILNQRMNFGKIVPWVKLVDGYYIKVNINVFLRYISVLKNDNTVIKSLLNNTAIYKYKNCYLKMLSPVDFLIHLSCCNVYKFRDINVFLQEYGCRDFFMELYERAKELGKANECYYTCRNSAVIFPEILKLEGYKEFIDEIECLLKGEE